MRRSSIRKKLATALAGPLALVVVITVLEVAEAAGEAREVRDQADLAEAVIGPAGIVTALQDERTWMSVELIGQEEAVTIPVRGYAKTRARTDAALTEFGEEVSRRGGLVAEAFGPAIDGLGGAVIDLRARIDAFADHRDLTAIGFTGEVFTAYSQVIQPFFDATTRLTENIGDTVLRQGAELADVVARQVETMSLLATETGTRTVLSGGLDRAGILEISSLLADYREQAGILREATGPYTQLAHDRFPETFTASVDGHVQGALLTGQLDFEAFVVDVNVPVDEGYVGYRDALHQLLQSRADHLRAAAEARRDRFATIAGVVLLVTVGLTLFVSLSIARALRSLTSQAQDLAVCRLPQAVQGIFHTPLGAAPDVPDLPRVTADADDELATVAAVLNAMQDSAVQLALEQAVLRRNVVETFRNFGRRNQNLLVRQVEFLTQVESVETDPDTLAALFRLDHLATRMRRNAESLLVLAGAGPSRTWTAHVGLHAVVRAALGEVEDYSRVAVHAMAPAAVAGSVASDLAHVLAELLENALMFSPPDRPVDVVGRDEATGAYTLVITDHGVGMTADELARANRRLVGDESFAVPPSLYLGHYVAGRLAARHLISLRLEPSPGKGVTAVVTVPSALLTHETAALNSQALGR